MQYALLLSIKGLYMKKVFFLSALLFIAVIPASFAYDRQLDFGVGLPFLSTKIRNTDTKENGIGFAMGYKDYFSKRWGFDISIGGGGVYEYSGLYFKQYDDIDNPNHILYNVFGEYLPQGHFDYAYYINGFMGPVFRIYENKFIELPISAGLNAGFISRGISDISYSVSEIFVGPGANAEALLKIGHFHFYVKINAMISLVAGQVERFSNGRYHNNEVDTIFYVNPSAGIGFSW
jgi:hypothetical protein